MPRGFFPGSNLGFFGGFAPFLLLPFLFNNNRRSGNVNIININTRRRNRDRDDFC